MPLTTRLLSAVSASLILFPSASQTQDRLKTLPQYTQFQKAQAKLDQVGLRSLQRGISGRWTDDGSAYEYRDPANPGKFLSFSPASGKTISINRMSENKGTRRRPGRFAGPERGRQFSATVSPDGSLKAVYRDNNLYLLPNKNLSSSEGTSGGEKITPDGGREKRIKYGTASWVYGEELDQVTAMWWSPDSKKLAFYRFDESGVKDYYLALQTTKVQDTLDVEAYPKSGAPNPVAEVMIYDLALKTTVTVDSRNGKPFADGVLGYYVYNVRWSPNGRELLLHRTNRLQKVMQLAAADPATGKCRVIAEESQPQAWAENNPTVQFLEDGDRFLFGTERNGFLNYDLYSLSGGKRLNPVTQNKFEAGEIQKVDEKAGVLYYLAWDGDNPLKAQLHRAKLDGSEDKRLTDPRFTHTVQISPDNKHFTDTAQSHDTPAFLQIVSTDTGKTLAALSSPDRDLLKKSGLFPSEIFSYKTPDGKTDLYGILHFPANFDPNKKYPLLVSVYAGPTVEVVSENFSPPDPLCSYGFLVASFDGRGTGRRGKAFKDAMYRHMGGPEIDDQAEGVKFLRQRNYVDGLKVGIFGTSYGGYASAMCLLRHPEVFAAAASQSPVTAWENYDTIYTERYMSTPQLNADGYRAGSAMTYAPNLKGRLMLYFGTADNNVHPANSLQLISALQQNGKSFEVQIGPDQEHTGMNEERMVEFFVEALKLNG